MTNDMKNISVRYN